MTVCVQTPNLWSAVTCHRFSALATCRQRRAASSGTPTDQCASRLIDGDKSPRESLDKSKHSKTCGRGVSRIRINLCRTPLN